jgi:hypothetical protein
MLMMTLHIPGSSEVIDGVDGHEHGHASECL